MSRKGIWRATQPARARDIRAHWFTDRDDPSSICGMCVQVANMRELKDAVAAADAGVVTCGLCRHVLAGQEEERALGKKWKGAP